MKYLIFSLLVGLVGCSNEPDRHLVAIINVTEMNEILSKCNKINPTENLLVYTNSITEDNGRGSNCKITIDCTSSDRYGESVYHINGEVYHNFNSSTGTFGKDYLCVSQYSDWGKK